jgi:hypothetical protein
MIKEFALEPDAITASYREFCYFTEKFGVSQGRVISEFPKKWRRMVCESAQRTHGGRVEFTRIVERLKLLKDEVVFDAGRPGGDGSRAWINRALDEHARQPFSAIIARENPTAHTAVLVSADLDDSESRFQATGQRHITRTAAQIVDSVGLLLAAAKTVKLIDPHFDPTKPRWRRMLGRVMNALSCNGQAGITLEIHRANNALPGNLKRCFESAIPGLLPAGITVQVFLHPEAAMHNRFILTSVGGASYHTGLDDNEDGNSTPTDLVSLLAPGIFATEWATYSGQTAFLVYS